MKRRTFAEVAALSALLPLLARGQGTYPERPVRLVVGFAPGGSADITARLFADKLGAEWRQPMVVDNRAGAGGNIGAEQVARATPDGYTLLLASAAQIVINPFMYRGLRFDPLKDLMPVSLLQVEPNAMVVNPSVPARDLREFIAWAKVQGDKVSFASPGVGTPAHLAGEWMNQMAGLKMVHVPYKGTGPAISDLVGGAVTVAIDNMPAYLPHIKSGKLRALGVTSERRAKVLPELPTLDESGLPGYVVTAWKGLMAPPGTPLAIIERLQASVSKVLAQTDLPKRMLEGGAEAVGSSPKQFADFIRTEALKWSALVKATGASAE